MDLLKTRRSIRVYQDKPVEEEKIEQVIQSALLAPTSKNTRPWYFIVVKDKDKLTKMADCRHPASPFLPKVPAAILILADEEKSDVWVEDCSIAAAFMQLKIAELFLASCWVQVRNRLTKDPAVTSEAYLKELLEIPDQYKVEAIIALGYPGEEKNPYDLERLAYDKVYKDNFGSPYFNK